MGSTAPSAAPRLRRDPGGDERRSEIASRVGSMAASENVSEIEQQILFNLPDRQSSSRLVTDDDVKSRSSVGQHPTAGGALLRAASELTRSISEVSGESDSSGEDLDALVAQVAAAKAEAPANEGAESDAEASIRLGGVCSI